MKKYSALFFASFFVFIFVALFQNVQLANAFIPTNGQCDLGIKTSLQATTEWKNNNCTVGDARSTCKADAEIMCDPQKDFCKIIDATKNLHECKANPALNQNPGGGQKTVLNCTCQSPQNAKNSKYTCKDPKTGKIVTGNGGKTVDACQPNQVCVQGTNNKDFRVIDQVSTIFDLTKYRISGLTCSAQQYTASCSCDSTGKNPTKVTCKNDQTGKTGSTTCSQNNICKAANAKQLVDRSQISGSDSFMTDSTLRGISCQHATATCTCGNANQDGSVTCTLLGKKSTANCGNANVCQTDANNTLATSDLESAPNGYANITMKGVKCTSPAKISLPPPPSPPCVTWVNGQCTLFNSAFGNLSTNPAQFIQAIFAILLSVSGGIALLLIIKAGYQLMTSQGKPDQINQARDQLIAAIVGLVFLIFSFVFLQLIGVDILHIPGFGGASGGGAAANCSCVDTTIAARGGSNNTIGSGSCPNGQVQVCH